MWAIINKELRELLRLLPVGLILMGVAVLFSLPQGLSAAVFRGGYGLIPCCAGIFAALLAAMQGFFDLSDRQQGFLFHRALSRSRNIYAKLLAALIVYLFVVSLPLALMAIYFARMGYDYLPVHPVQLVPVAASCLACFVMHPAMLITIDREASWFGIRWLPLPIAIGSLFFIAMFLLESTESTSPFLAGVLFIVVATLYGLAMERKHVARKLLVGGGAVCIVLVATATAITMLESLTRRPMNQPVAYNLDADGNLWAYQFKYETSENGYTSTQVAVSGDRVQSDRAFNLNATLPNDFNPERALVGLVHIGQYPTQPGRYQYAGTAGNRWFFYAPPGIALVYDPTASPPFVGTVSRSGFRPAGDAYGEPFSDNALVYGTSVSSELVQAGYEPLWADREGIYQFDRKAGNLETLIDEPLIESAVVIVSPDEEAEGGKIVRVFIQTDSHAQVYRLSDDAGTSNWFVDNPESRSRPLPKLRAVAERSLPRLPDNFGLTAIGLASAGDLVAVDPYSTFQYARLVDAPNAVWKLEPLNVTNFAIKPNLVTSAAYGTMPPIVLAVGTVGTVLYALAYDLPLPKITLANEGLAVFLLTTSMIVLMSTAAVWILGRQRGLSTKSMVTWSVATVIFGLATPLMVVALYRRVHYATCPRCNQLRRIDGETCERCGAAWEPLPSQGIEVFDFVANREYSTSTYTSA